LFIVTARDEKIGRNIARLRDDMSQKELAEKMANRGWKWSQATVWSVEAGKRPIRFAEAVDICWILGAEMRLLEGDDDELKANFFIGKYFQAIDDVRDALTKATNWQLELAQIVEDQNLPDASTKEILATIRSDDVLDAFVRMFVNIVRDQDAELRGNGKAHPGTYTNALLDAWLLEVKRITGPTT